MESKFITELDLRDIDDRTSKLLFNLKYQSFILNDIIIVPKGFITDKASVPRIPIIYFFFGDRAHREAVIHDYLYQSHITTKKIADKIFLEAMKVRKKNFFIRWCMYLGVVIGGKKAYETGPDRLIISQK